MRDLFATELGKQGAGTFNITGVQTYDGLTTTGGAGSVTNIYTKLGTGASTLTANATTNIYKGQVLAALTIGAGVEVTFGEAPPFAGEPEKIGAPALVPEPGALGLLVGGALGLLSRPARGGGRK